MYQRRIAPIKKGVLMYSVYMHKFPNNKVYIGITNRPVNVRWCQRYNRYFTNAVKKYGWDNIQHIVIAENLTHTQACTMEINLIASYRSNDARYGYNLTDGGEGILGFQMPEKSRKRISEALTGRHLPDSVKEKISNSTKGKIVSESTKEKLREINKGRISPNKGKSMSEEQRIKISVARKGFVMSDEQKDKLRQVHLGKVTSDETKLKLSKVNKGRVYVNNGTTNIRVFESELDKYLQQGYIRGIVHTKKYKLKKLKKVF